MGSVKNQDGDAMTLLDVEDVKFIASQPARNEALKRLGDNWVWVAAARFSERGGSVITISKVSVLAGSERVVVVHQIREIFEDISMLDFCRRLVFECCSGEFPGITIIAESADIYKTILALRREARVVRLDLTLAPQSSAAKGRFSCLMAMGQIYTKEAALSGRLAIDSDQSTIDQLSALQLRINDSGQWCVEGEPGNRSATYAFFQAFER